MHHKLTKLSIVILILTVLICAMGASSIPKQLPVGRFQLELSPADSRYAFVIDNATGQVWKNTGKSQEALL